MMNLKKIKQHNAFTLAEGGRSPLLSGDEGTQGSPRLVKRGFTLAEVLITLGVIGVVAAVTMPTLVTNIQERVRKEQVRTVKYKLTKATDKMNSLGKIKQYDTTMDFVNEIKKHMSIAKICDNNELDKCWPSSEINAYSGSGTTLTVYNPKDLTTGQSLKALALSTKSTQTVGIVTGDGVPMLMVYSPSPSCNEFDEAKTYTWSVEDGKPVTNATTNCLSAIFDINGAKGPNKIGTDVRTLNSLFGATDLRMNYEPAGVNICNKMKQKYGIKYCSSRYTKNNEDYWVGGIYACDKLGLHLPNRQTLAQLAGARFGVSTIETNTIYLPSNRGGNNCIDWLKENLSSMDIVLPLTDKVICNADMTTEQNASIALDGHYYANEEYSEHNSFDRHIMVTGSTWNICYRGYKTHMLCVGD